MNRLLSTKVKRGQVLREWENSEHQSTMDGLMDFKARQEARRVLAQMGVPRKVLTLKRERS